MTQALSLVYRYFSVDCDTDPTQDLIEISSDKITWSPAGWVDPPAGADAAELGHPVAAGLTRYWLSTLTGPGQALAPTYGTSLVHGRLTDHPEIPYFRWKIYAPLE